MTKQEREAQILSFASGNVALHTGWPVEAQKALCASEAALMKATAEGNALAAALDWFWNDLTIGVEKQGDNPWYLSLPRSLGYEAYQKTTALRDTARAILIEHDAEKDKRIDDLKDENKRLREGFDEEGCSLAERCCGAIKTMQQSELDRLRKLCGEGPTIIGELPACRCRECEYVRRLRAAGEGRSE
jgi:hypothetical protein